MPIRACAVRRKPASSVVVTPGWSARAAARCTSSVMALARSMRAISAALLTWRHPAVIGPALVKLNALPARRMASTVKNGVAGSIATTPFS